MVTPPPFADLSKDCVQTDSPHEPVVDVGLEAGIDNGQWFQGVIGFLIACTIHVLLLLIMALIVRSDDPRSLIVMELSTVDFDAESYSLRSLEIEDVESPSPGDSPEEFVASASLALQRVVEVGVAPLDLEAGIVSPPPRRGSDHAMQKTKAAKKKDAGVKFFGTHAYGNKFVYVLDASGSMGSGNGRRMQRARTELVRSINELQPHHSFYVVLYNDRAFNMFDIVGQARLRPATPANKDFVTRWISGVRPTGGTMPADALKIAGDLLPDAVFFLSDGDFIYGAEPGIAIDQFIRGFGQARPGVLQGHPMGQSRFPKSVLDAYAPQIVVHTIALESESSRRQMELIAKSKGGEHRFIRAPQPVDLPRRRALAR